MTDDVQNAFRFLVTLDPFDAFVPRELIATALEMEDGRLRSARIALAGVSDAPVRATEAEAIIAGATPDADVIVTPAPGEVTSWPSAKTSPTITKVAAISANSRVPKRDPVPAEPGLVSPI